MKIGSYYIDKQKYQTLKACFVSPGDLLISLVGTFGKVIVVPAEVEPGIINPRLIRISLDSRIACSHYMKMFLTSPEITDSFEKIAHGGTMGILNATKLKELSVSLPPLNEQKRIVAKLDAIFARTRAARERLAKIPALLEKLKQSVLA